MGKMRKPHLLVVGGTGFIGYHLAKNCLKKGWQVTSFKEKSHLEEGWINGGFFIIEPKFFSFIDGDDAYLEREPLEQAVSEGEFFAYKHNGFWQCMDTKRDKDNLEEIYLKGAPWEK